jgi:phycocyanin-associated, rod
MIPTNISNLSEDAGRTFEIEVTGSPHQARLRTSGYKVRVPYSALSTTINSIGQRGGKIVSVKKLSLFATEVASSPEPAEPHIPAATETAPPIVEEQAETVVRATTKSNSKAFVPAQNKSSKSKKR